MTEQAQYQTIEVTPQPVNLAPTPQVAQTVAVETPVTPPEPVEVVPDNVVTLSTGVRVQFLGKLPQHIAQRIVVNLFHENNIDVANRVVDNANQQKQMELAYSMFQMNSSLVSNGMFFGVLKLWDEPKDRRWLRLAQNDASIYDSHPNLDWNDKESQDFIYMLHFAFTSLEDFELLSQKLLNN